MDVEQDGNLVAGLGWGIGGEVVWRAEYRAQNGVVRRRLIDNDLKPEVDARQPDQVGKIAKAVIPVATAVTDDDQADTALGA